MTLLLRRTAFGLPLLAAAGSVHAEIPMAAKPLSRMDLKWWNQRHLAKLEELKRKKPNLIFLGDSITQDWEVNGPQPWAQYHDAWQRFYGDRNAVNLGFNGDATCHLLWRIQNGEVDGIAPKVSVVLIGANNLGRLKWSAEDTLSGIQAILFSLRQRLPATKILLLSVLPSDRGEWVVNTTRTINRGLAERYKQGGLATYLDVSGSFMRGGRIDTDLFSDPKLTPPVPALHPTADGQIVLSKAIEPTLASLLGDKIHS